MYPLVSIIIPIYNSFNYINDCVDSAVKQTYKNLEIILIDDGSTDGTYELILEKYSELNCVKIFTHENRENKGVTETRRLGIKNANGEYVAFLDADDWFELNKIELQVDIMEKNIDIVLVHSSANFYNEIDKDIFFNDFRFSNKSFKYKIELDTFLKTNHICNSSVMVRKNNFEKLVIPIQQTFQYEDWIHWILLSEYGSFYYMNEKTCNYRYHFDSSTAHLVRRSSLNLYANLEKNIILYKLFKKSKNHKLIRTNIYDSLNEIHYHLFNNESFSFDFYLNGLINSIRLK